MSCRSFVVRARYAGKLRGTTSSDHFNRMDQILNLKLTKHSIRTSYARSNHI